MPTIKNRRAMSQCSVPECTKQAQTRKLCKAHGGGKRCRGPNCVKLAQSQGLCVSHGGGRRCSNINCAKLAQYKGLCLAHGGGRRCRVPDCQKFIQIRGCCKSHAKLQEILSRTLPDLPLSDCASPEAFQEFQLSPRSSDLTSYWPQTRHGNDNCHHPHVFDHCIDKPSDHTSPREIQTTGTVETITPLVLYRPLCRRLYCQARLIQGRI